jgi:cytochrome c553
MKKLLVLGAIAAAAFAYTDCAMCHNGGMAQKLDTLTPAQIVKKMKEFKAGKGNPMMVNIAKGMSDKEIEEAAKKYGKK